MSARPWFHFFPADWQADVNLRMTSLAAQGLWVHLLCVMHGADPRGHLIFAGKPLGAAQVAKLVGCDSQEARDLLAELEAAAVFDRTDAGVIVSRKMVRDTAKALKQAANANARWVGSGDEAGIDSAGGNANGNATRVAKVDAKSMPHIPLPLLDSSSPNGEESSPPLGRPKRRPATPPSPLQSTIDAIWAAAPKTSRARSSRADVERHLSAAVNRGHAPEAVLAGLRGYFASEDVTRDDGRFAKGIHRMIEADRWQGFAADVAPAVNPADLTDAEWTPRLGTWGRGMWSEAWGPKPGEPGCFVPSRLLLAAA